MSQRIPSLLKAEEVAQILKVKPQTIYIWAREGKIPSIRLGRLTRFRESDVRNFDWAEDIKKVSSATIFPSDHESQ